MTDSAAGLAPELAAAWTAAGDFACVPMPLMIGDQIFPGAEDPRLEEQLVIGAAEGRRMSTSKPSPGAFAAAYRGLAERGFEEIVSIHLSEELSGTVSTARASARDAPVPVTVLDTRTVAMAQGFAVAAALRTARRGGSADEAVEAARVSLEGTRLLFYVPTLEALARSGRIPKGLAVVGQMFQIKPIATVSGGKLKYLERPRQEAAARRRLVELAVEDVRGALRAQAALAGDVLAGEASGPDEAAARDGGSGMPGPDREKAPEAVLAIHDFYGRQLADLVEDGVAAAFGSRVRLLRYPLPPVLAVHAGLGPVALVAAPAALAGELESPGA
ncbi:DegV family protein [Rothia sp. AR01]|uniref:DegV family protein n=1 Tax=Rothia santali TaxID=2949643 RepID=A0A9X2KIE6_9MICC|nr:DegV family protein [Rothia santali]MCP3426817.1 DegV family protein [Rothia santali]